MDQVKGILGLGRLLDSERLYVALCIIPALLLVIMSVVSGEEHPLAVVPEKRWIVAVGLALVQVPKELVETHAIGSAVLAAESQAPLAEKSGPVTGSLEEAGNGDIFRL